MNRSRKFEFRVYRTLKWFELTFAKCGYFDGRPEINIYLYFISFVIKLPWINEKWTDECDPPKYGIAIHNGTFWLHLGGNGNMKGGSKWWSWDFPWFTEEFYKHYILGKDGNWIDVTFKWKDKETRELFENHIGYLGFGKGYLPDEESLAQTYYGVWHDDYDNTDINAKYRVEVRIWRPKWFMWTDKFQFIRKSIDVCFEDEVGSRKGSWKGGTIGAGHDFKDIDLQNFPETPEECFARMNKERNW